VPFDRYCDSLLFYRLASTVCGYLWFKSRSLILSAYCVECTFAFIIVSNFAEDLSAGNGHLLPKLISENRNTIFKPVRWVLDSTQHAVPARQP